MDLRQLIRTLVQVNPVNRPDCDQILGFSIVEKRYKKYFCDQEGNPLPIMQLNDSVHMSNQDMLKTIKLRKNVFKLSLPRPAYTQLDNYQTMPLEKPLKKSESVKRVRPLQESPVKDTKRKGQQIETEPD